MTVCCYGNPRLTLWDWPGLWFISENSASVISEMYDTCRYFTSDFGVVNGIGEHVRDGWRRGKGSGSARPHCLPREY
ncbi:hypothetical protein E2C01_031549 [Portunus trituberculatus]|uniref:Uncharacterized protein n=1 Tax=Portunus trituberculatus TaxID=210409 RepID=A0A5B7EYE9_PORTR|nr:hypothetical protein [Portunus trituberculatus]